MTVVGFYIVSPKVSEPVVPGVANTTGRLSSEEVGRRGNYPPSIIGLYVVIN